MSRRRLLRFGLAVFMLVETVLGLWQLLFPRHFYDNLPTPAHAWVAALPPYNEHLLRDQGALHLALAVVYGAAVFTMDRRLTQVAPLANLAFNLPHFVFHATHTDALPPGDAVAQTVVLLVGVLLPLGLLLLALRPPHPGPKASGVT
ncbi:hypothetical protein [Rhizohabitans arisaemae]|uniref:hypothetical protein n=1 Tax=Rhizohabitans arisaemae TaxID=2720610 RepID=UPI0024B1817C|nr:hypothetical protein [Rhizohabitans arisaemae]